MLIEPLTAITGTISLFIVNLTGWRNLHLALHSNFLINVALLLEL